MIIKSRRMRAAWWRQEARERTVRRLQVIGAKGRCAAAGFTPMTRAQYQAWHADLVAGVLQAIKAQHLTSHKAHSVK